MCAVEEVEYLCILLLLIYGQTFLRLVIVFSCRKEWLLRVSCLRGFGTVLQRRRRWPACSVRRILVRLIMYNNRRCFQIVCLLIYFITCVLKSRVLFPFPKRISECNTLGEMEGHHQTLCGAAGGHHKSPVNDVCRSVAMFDCLFRYADQERE